MTAPVSSYLVKSVMTETDDTQALYTRATNSSQSRGINAGTGRSETPAVPSHQRQVNANGTNERGTFLATNIKSTLMVPTPEVRS